MGGRGSRAESGRGRFHERLIHPTPFTKPPGKHGHFSAPPTAILGGHRRHRGKQDIQRWQSPGPYEGKERGMSCVAGLLHRPRLPQALEVRVDQRSCCMVWGFLGRKRRNHPPPHRRSNRGGGSSCFGNYGGKGGILTLLLLKSSGRKLFMGSGKLFVGTVCLRRGCYARTPLLRD